MALWIKTSGVTESLAPKNSKHFTIEELQHCVGGYIEALPLEDGRIMWLNEEGKLDGLPFNSVANGIAHKLTRIAQWDDIVGDVLVTTQAESEDDEKDED